MGGQGRPEPTSGAGKAWRLQLWPVAVLCLAGLVCMPQGERYMRRVFIASVFHTPLETVVADPCSSYFTVSMYVVQTAKDAYADVWMAHRSTIGLISFLGFSRPVLPRTFVTDDAVALAALSGLVHRYWPNSPPDLVIVSRKTPTPDYYRIVVADREASQRWVFSVSDRYVVLARFTDSR